MWLMWTLPNGNEFSTGKWVYECNSPFSILDSIQEFWFSWCPNSVSIFECILESWYVYGHIPDSQWVPCRVMEHTSTYMQQWRYVNLELTSSKLGLFCSFLRCIWCRPGGRTSVPSQILQLCQKWVENRSESPFSPGDGRPTDGAWQYSVAVETAETHQILLIPLLTISHVKVSNAL